MEWAVRMGLRTFALLSLFVTCLLGCHRASPKSGHPATGLEWEDPRGRVMDRISSVFYAIQWMYEEDGVLPEVRDVRTVIEIASEGNPEQFKPAAGDNYTWEYGPIYSEDGGETHVRKIQISLTTAAGSKFQDEGILKLDVDPIRWDPMYDGTAADNYKPHLDTRPYNISKVVACAVWKESQKATRWITQPDLLCADEEYRDADDKELLTGFSARIEKTFGGKRAWFEKDDKGGWIVVLNSSTGTEYWFPDDGPETKRIAVTMTPDGKRVRLR